MKHISFNKSFLAGNELKYIEQAVLSGQIKGDGPFTKKCNEWMEQKFNAKKVLLTTSCTSALEMSAILCDIKPGYEVIMPSYTFVSTANAFVIRGAKPVFVDIRPDTLNIDETKIEDAITSKTKAIVPVHYAGVGCEMDIIMRIAKKHNLFVIEDAAQGVMAKYKNKYLGTIGDLGTYSFHETKNYSSGEGGAIVINNPDMIERAEIIREKGTNRSKFFRGEVDKYTWVDVGSSYLPSEIIAAFLLAQLEKAEEINQKRLEIWQNYYNGLKELEEKKILRLPIIPDNCKQNAHMFYILLQDKKTRNDLMDFLKKEKNILSVFHYVPLHSAPMGKKVAPNNPDLPITDDLSARLLRLPFYYNLTKEEQNYIIELIEEFFS